MSQGVERIGKRDVLWSYASTGVLIGSGIILLPFILRMMPSQTVGIWNIFQTVTTLVLLLDFGFRPSFARNVSYIFSGVSNLQAKGVTRARTTDVDYGLLKGALLAMRGFYRKMALAAFLILVSAGTLYIRFILRNYEGDRSDAGIAWIILICVNCYNLYTMYYDALMLGKGYVKRSQQITILGQSLYILLAIVLIYRGYGLSAIVASNLVSIVVRRVLSYRIFFNKSLVENLNHAETADSKEIIRAIYPNAIKVGLTNLGGFLVNKSAIFIGSAFLSLEEIAFYGITLQVLDVMAHCGMVVYQTFLPKLAECRTRKDIPGLKQYYLWSFAGMMAIYVLGSVIWVLLGDWALDVIGSSTRFAPVPMLCVMILISLLNQNHSLAAGFIMSDNRVPFFIPSIVSGLCTILLMWVSLDWLAFGIWGMILSPGLVQLAYQNWKWPHELFKEFRVIS